MTEILSAQRAYRTGVAAILTGTLVWGLVWYPFRMLQDAGLGGATATLLVYALALLMALLVPALRARPRLNGWMLLLGLSCGVTNLAYVLAVLDGVVVRVMLLFYLAPVWTLVFARLLLGEVAGRRGLAVVALAMGGAMVMLSQSGMGLPLPRNGAEWLGVLAGVSFALMNVLGRRLAGVPVGERGVVMLAGVVVVTLPVSGLAPVAELPDLPAAAWLVLLGVVLSMLGVTWFVQYGLGQVAANRAAVLFLLELVFAALSAWWLEGEALGLREWTGGLMIITAAVLSARATEPRRAGAPGT